MYLTCAIKVDIFKYQCFYLQTLSVLLLLFLMYYCIVFHFDSHFLLTVVHSQKKGSK